MHSDSGLSIETFFVLLIMALDYGESCLREDDSPLPQAIKVVGTGSVPLTFPTLQLSPPPLALMQYT